MKKQATLTIRLDDDLKRDVDTILDRLDIKATELIKGVYTYTQEHGQPPIAIRYYSVQQAQINQQLVNHYQTLTSSFEALIHSSKPDTTQLSALRAEKGAFDTFLQKNITLLIPSVATGWLQASQPLHSALAVLTAVPEKGGQFDYSATVLHMLKSYLHQSLTAAVDMQASQ